MLHTVRTALLLRPCRLIATTTVCRKQPPHDRQRYKRHHPEPRHTVPFIDEAPLDHLPRRPPTTAGLWGSTDPAVKAQRYKHEQQLKQIPTTFEKFQELYHLEPNLWYHSLDLPLQHPEMLQFCQQLTRTNVIYPWEPEPGSDYSLAQEYLSHAISEYLLQQNHFPVNTVDTSPEAVLARNQKRGRTIAAYMEAFYQAWLRIFPDSYVACRPHQLDERGTVETFLKRKVPPELFSVCDDVVEDMFDEVNETVLDSKEGTVRYRIRSELAWQLRGTDPLKPFIPWDDPLCLENRVPLCNYRPEAFDLKPVDCYEFSCLPHTESLDFSEFARSVAGFWSRSPFWEGDPCEFGHIGALDVARSERIHRNLLNSRIPEAVKQEVLVRHALSEGILTAFAWTSAQAYNQGFTLYNELTYPLATQLLLMDDEHVQLLRYQLNSLTSLWKADDSGLPFNMAWLSPKVRLYTLDPNTPGTVSVNPQAIALLASAMAYPVDENRSSTSLRPYLEERLAPRDRAQPTADPSTFLIPNGDDESLGEPSDSSSPSFVLPAMSEREQEALEASKQADRKLAHRIFAHARPHPNDVFFLKMTNKSALIQELTDEMPDFGGQFSRLPEPYNSRSKNFKIQHRNRQLRLRVQAPPRRWR